MVIRDACAEDFDAIVALNEREVQQTSAMDLHRRWFAVRFPQFVYIDRIVVGADFAGLKIGSRLYEDLFAYGRSQGIKAITCEYNIEPPNPASKRFHDKFGFKELGRHWVADGTKLVTLQVAESE